MKDPQNLVSRLVFLFGIIILAGTAHGWSAIPSGSSESGPKVSGHSIGTTSDGKTTILFGGLTGAAGSPCTDQTWKLKQDGSTLHWNLLEPTNRPRQRMYAASAILEHKLFLFGGWDPGEPGSGGEFLDDVWEFDLESKEWSELKTCKLPYPVSRHTACTMTLEDHEEEAIVLHTYKGLLVFRRNKTKGGDWIISPQPYRILNDDGGTIWSKNQEDGDASISPNGLSMCAMAPLDSRKLVLVGGSTKTQQLSKDIFLLDTQDWTWRKLDLDDALPALASACAARVKDGTVAVFGGATLGTQGYNGGMGLVPLNDLHLLKQVKDDKFQLTKEESFETLPEGRVAATLSPIGKNSLLLQGGYDPITKTAFDTPWVVETMGLE